MKKEIDWIVKNWAKIPDSFKTNLKQAHYSSGDMGNIAGVPLDEHIVVLLLDRQKPSVQRDYSFDEERVGITRTGKIIWGFDSGCSCPSPWHDNYPGCYSCAESWKTFEVELSHFDEKALEETQERVAEIKKAV